MNARARSSFFVPAISAICSVTNGTPAFAGTISVVVPYCASRAAMPLEASVPNATSPRERRA